MAGETSMKQLIQGIAGKGMPDIVKAVVVRMEPELTMALVKDRAIELTGKTLIVPPARKWRMGVGSAYYLLCFNGGHVYYVLDRAEGDTDG